jgi:anti-anti-sigma factor
MLRERRFLLTPKSGSSLSRGELANGYALSRVARNGERVTLTVYGEIDIANAGAFTDEARSLINDAGGQVALDLENCEFIDSTGIRALIVLAQEQQARGPDLELNGVTGEPLRALRLSGVLESSLFAMDPDGAQGRQS